MFLQRLDVGILGVSCAAAVVIEGVARVPLFLLERAPVDFVLGQPLLEVGLAARPCGARPTVSCCSVSLLLQGSLDAAAYAYLISRRHGARRPAPCAGAPG